MRYLTLLLLISLLLFLPAGCGSKERARDATSTVDYDVVSEGDASGVASTINGPGEVSPPAMTATNIDTTTDLAITGQPAAPTATTGNLAGALPTTTAPATGTPVYVPRSNPPTGIMRRTPPTPPSPTYPPATAAPRPVPTQTVPPSTTHPQPEPAPTAPAVPPTTTQAPTDTSQTDTSLQPVQPPEKKKGAGDRKKKDEPPPPPPEQTDTTSTNPGR